MFFKKIITITFLIFFPASMFANELPLPRWVSLNAEANMRKGPSTNASIMYRYQFEGYPMEILRQTETWRYVRDPMTGTEGWMNRILFNGARHIITANKEHSFGYKNADKSKIIAKLAFGVHGKILSCDSSWCYVSILNNEKVRKMYIEKKNLYGVYTHEIID